MARPPDPDTYFDDEGMMHRVRAGDLDLLRRYFDRTLAGEAVHLPGWRHLKQALQQDNLSMMRLLITWGATPTDDDLQQLADELGDKSTAAFTKLRVAGLNIKDLPQPRPRAPRSINEPWLIPGEWITVLQQLQKNGAPEAMIVGGALRDTFNGRAVKDVDIFLKAPMFGNRKKMLRKVFDQCGLVIHMTRDTDYSSISEDSLTRTTKIPNSYDREHSAFGRLDTWKVVAGPNRTEYNIIFVNSPLADQLRDEANPKKVHPDNIGSVFNFAMKPARQQFLNKIDISICQIIFTGKELITSMAYDRDVHEKKITLLNPANSSLMHIERVVSKYRDFEPCSATRMVRATRKLPVRSKPVADARYMSHYVAGRMYM